MSQGQYVATRPFPTTHRQYEIGDMIDMSRISSSELNAGVTSGAIEPAKFIDTAARLAALNPVLGPGVHAYETDTGVHKIGVDGVTHYADLDQVGNGTYARRSAEFVHPSRWVLAKPVVMASPPSVTAGTANAASAIAGSTLRKPNDQGTFTFLGGPVIRKTTYPGYNGLTVGTYPQVTSSAPSAVEFVLDTSDSTGRFEINTIGAGAKIRVAVMSSSGRWEYITAAETFTHPADGNGYLDLVTLGAAGRYNIRVELAGNVTFLGIQCSPTATIMGRNQTTKRYIAVGDSFSEPTVNESGSYVYHDGWPVILSLMTGLDIWCSGSGGTGYLQTNGARPKFRDRLVNDVLAYNPDGIIWAGGVNDYGNFTAAQIGAESLACFQAAEAARPGIDQVVLSPFWPKTITAGATNLLMTRDALRTSALAVGARFLDLLSLPTYDYLGSWSAALGSSPSAGGTTFQVPSIPTYFLTQIGVGGVNGWYVQIGTGTNAEVRAVTNITGSGPYTLTVAALANAHTAGETVKVVGPSYMTGTGNQGATTGSGNADRYTGADTTHPTVKGHEHIAQTVAWLWARSLKLAA